MTRDEISAAYQKLLRQSYPRVIVRPDENEWNPYYKECYDAFFIPDSAAGEEYINHWVDDGGWYDQAKALGLPKVSILAAYDSDVKEHYSHLFPEIFGKKVSASAKSKKSKSESKVSKTRVAKTRAASVRN